MVPIYDEDVQEPSKEWGIDGNLERNVEIESIDEVAFKQGVLDYSSLVPIYDDDDVEELSKVDYSEEVVEASCVEMINDHKGDVEGSYGELVDDLEEVVKTTCIEEVGSRMETL